MTTAAQFMRRVATALLLAAATVLAVTSLAAANRLALTSGTTFRVVFTEGTRERFVICPMTLEGSFHSATFNKITGSLIGYITRASMEEARCTGGGATFLQETLPWHIRYRGFAGTLPFISAMATDVIGLGIRARFGEESFSCLYLTTTTTPGVAIWGVNGEGVINSFRWSEVENIPGTGGFECMLLRKSLIGVTPLVTRLASTAVLTLRLI